MLKPADMKIRYFIAAIAAVAMIGCTGSKTDSEAADSTAVETVSAEETAEAEPAEAEAVVSDEEAVIELEADDRIVPQDVPVIVDFNATWCGPCQKFGPVFHKVAAEYADKATFASCDVDVCKALAEEYNISSIPAVVVIYPEATGKTPVTNVGFMDEAQFKAFLDKNL